MDEIIFTNGIIFKLPRQGAPDFVKGSISFKLDEAIEWLKQNQNNGWCNIDLKVSRQGKAYACLNTWKPSQDNVNSSYKPKSNLAMDKNDEVIF